MLKTITVTISPASILVKRNDISMLVPSMVLSTVFVLAVMTVVPWMAPVLMADVTRSPV